MSDAMKSANMTVRAKFKVDLKTETKNGHQVQLSPVIGESEENKRFYKYTPSGSIDLTTINPSAADQFKVGAEFYVDFTPA